MSLVNSNISYTGLVEKYIGSAYDTVKLVAGSLEDLETILKLIESEDYEYLLNLGKHIDEFLEEMKDFQSTYYGSFVADPILDPLGNPMTPGDMYFNTTLGYLMGYNGLVWAPLGVVNQTKERVIVGTGDVDTTWTYVNVDNSYVLGTNNLSVYADGQHLMASVPNDPAKDWDYEEVGPNAIRIKTGLAPVGTQVDLTVGTEVANVKHFVDVEIYTTDTTTNNQGVVTLPSPAAYILGSNNLEVYLERRLLLEGVDYLEETPNSIILLVNSTIGNEVLFKIGQVLTTAPNTHRVIMKSSVPDNDLYEDGQLWVNTATMRTYFNYQDTDSRQWVSIGGEEVIIYAPTIP